MRSYTAVSTGRVYAKPDGRGNFAGPLVKARLLPIFFSKFEYSTLICELSKSSAEGDGSEIVLP